jgi:putative solute:sodium symporter small subunit
MKKWRRHMENSTKYDINFFTPHTPFLKETVRLVTIGLLVWAIAVYGFHTLLRIIEKPTPEKAYLTYEKIYPKLTQGTATLEEQKEMGVIYLGLIGKSTALMGNAALKNAFTSVVYSILPDSEKEMLVEASGKIQTDKKVDVRYVVKALGIENDLSRKAVVPYAIMPLQDGVKGMISPEIPKIMSKYLIHNQSVLTDTIFLGFPFHYFYSAVFLLALFVIICLVYCKAIDKVMKKHDMESEYE